MIQQQSPKVGALTTALAIGDAGAQYQQQQCDKGPTPYAINLAPSERAVIELPLPGCLKPVVHALVGHLLYQDDDFVQIVRKVTLLMGLVCAILEVGLVAYHLYIFLTLHYGGDLVLCIGFFVSGVAYIGSLSAMQVEKHCSDRLACTIVLNATVSITVLNLFSTAYDTRILNVTVALLAIVLQVPYAGAVALYQLLLALHGLHTDKYLPEDGAFLMLMPGTRISTGLEPVLLSLAVSVSLTVLIVLAVWFSSEEQKRQMIGARKNVQLTNRVVGHLRKYNTDPVLTLLQDAKEDKESDHHLLHAFEALVGNLERYRPFLPNYLFLSDADLSEDEGEPEMELETADGGVGQMEASDHTLDGNSHSSFMAMQRKGSVSSCPSVNSSSSSRSTTTALHVLSEGPRSSRSGVAPLCSSSSNSGASHHRGTIAHAWVELKCSEWFSFSLTNKSQGNQQHTLSTFTDTLFDIAHSSKASIHTMVGDRVQLSWNATHRVAQPESKAAMFLLKLRDALATKIPDSHTLAAACCSGPAEVHQVLSAATKQQALYVDASWLPVLECCYALATKHHTIVIDAATAIGAQYEVEAQGVDCIRYKPRVALLADGVTSASSDPLSSKHAPVVSLSYAKAPFTQPWRDYESLVSDLRPSDLFRTHFSPTDDCEMTMGGGRAQEAGHIDPVLLFSLAFELLSLKDMAENEWMYQLHESANKKTSATATTGALRHVVEGHFGEAVEALEHADDLRLVTTSGSFALPEEQRDERNILTMVEQLTNFCHAGIVAKGR